MWQEPRWGAKPPTYNGDITKRLCGSRAFKRYLKKFDARWAELPGRIQELKGAAVTPEHEATLTQELWLGDIETWKGQLLQFLENFSAGETGTHVVAGEEPGVFTSWGRLADKGQSLRPEHANDLRRAAFAPRKAVPAKDLKLAIS